MTITITSYGILVAALVGYLAILAPVLACRKMADLRHAVARGDSGARNRSYRQTMVSEWVGVFVFLGWWLLEGRTLADVGLGFAAAGWQWLALAVCAVVTVLLVLHVQRAGRDADSLAEARTQLGSLVAMVPHTRGEFQRFTWLSITAGICEEIIYRGLLMTALASLVGLWPAVALSSVVFGLGHAYQGAGGIVRTGLAGLVLALVVVFTGSLVAAMVMHAVLDMVQGRLMWIAVNDDSTESPLPNPA